MEIKRFDEVEFEVLECVYNRMGYYPEGANAERAEVLMSEGILEDSPRRQWQKSGWKFTEFGKEYYKEFIAKVRLAHGHTWVTKREAYGEDVEDGDSPYRFGYSSGYHNGYECSVCGFTFCVHCENEFSVQKCTHENHSG